MTLIEAAVYTITGLAALWAGYSWLLTRRKFWADVGRRLRSAPDPGYRELREFPTDYTVVDHHFDAWPELAAPQDGRCLPYHQFLIRGPGLPERGLVFIGTHAGCGMTICRCLQAAYKSGGQDAVVRLQLSFPSFSRAPSAQNNLDTDTPIR